MRLIKIVICLFVLFACNHQSADKLAIKDQRLNEVILNSEKPIIVFFHSGECSMCYGTLKQISLDFPESTLISISALNNADLIDYYLESIRFSGFSVIDSSSHFFNENRSLLQTNNLFLIDNFSTLLYRTSTYNKNDSESIKDIIRKKAL
jgi:hypothetical protein